MTKDSSVVEDLRRARDLIAQGWCQGAGALDARGNLVDVNDPRATSWSILGAVVAASEGKETRTAVASRALVQALGSEFLESLENWNDTPGRTQTEVFGLIDRTIAQLEQLQKEGRSMRTLRTVWREIRRSPAILIPVALALGFALSRCAR